MKVVFIASPYIGDGSSEIIEKNIAEAESYAIALANRKIPFFCPHTHTRHFEAKANAPEDFYKKLDFHFLHMICGAVLALPRWQESSGAKHEVDYARSRGYPVFFPKSPDDQETFDLVDTWINNTP